MSPSCLRLGLPEGKLGLVAASALSLPSLKGSMLRSPLEAGSIILERRRGLDQRSRGNDLKGVGP